jgi:eukaryotic-like serine/threonine-protein kinase
MTIPSGARLGPYEILSPLGAGGMGEVYEARDTRLDRTVAVKVLPERMALNPELRARFEREARAVSKLSHPNICTLHDVGEAQLPAAGEGVGGPAGGPGGGRAVPYLVMEHLDGETLEARLRRGGALPTREVLEIGRQIALALAAAHRQGVVHRDLKPANVMLTRGGVKLLDFGLARLLREAEALSESALDVMVTEAQEAPLTGEGTILGTFFYMAPEQLEGREADARSDLFALGAVLYEMATGRRAFEGTTRASVIAAVLEREPEPICGSDALAPPALDHVVSRCLAKDPEERWQSARDVASELQWIAEQGSQAGVPVPLARRRRSRERLAWGVAAVLGLGTIVLGILLFSGTSPEPMPTVRFSIEMPQAAGVSEAPMVSPDGSRIAFVAADDAGTARLWLRSLDSAEAHPLPGTAGAGSAFWSPDGRSIAFFAGGELRRFDLDGSVRTLCPAPDRYSGTWGSRGDILFGFERVLMRVPEGGGIPTPVPILPGVEGDAALGFWPHFLPDGKHFLLAIWHGGQGGIYVASLGTPERRLLIAARSLPDLSRTGYDQAGFLVFARDGALLAQRLDPRRLELAGEPFRIADRVHVAGPGAATFSVSRNGVLAYRETETSRSVQLSWVDRAGTPVGDVGPPGLWLDPSVSPDGRLVAAARGLPGEPPSVWLLDIARGTVERLTSGFFASNPVWSPTGDRLAFAGAAETPPNPFLLDLARRGEPARLGRYPHQLYPMDWSPDGRHLLAWALHGAESGGEIWRLPVDGGAEPEVLTRGRRDTRPGQGSPDGRWLAYASEESGRWEVYLAPMLEPGRPQLVSTAGGQAPRWSPDGRTLFYLAPDHALMAVPVGTEPVVTLGLPEPLFTVPPGSSYDVAPDGERFLLPLPTGERHFPPIYVVVNWRSGLGG